MISKERLKQVLTEQREAILKKEFGVKRTALLELGEKIKLPHVLVITGLRRTGKSTLLRQAIKEYYQDKEFYYVSFEDERLTDFKAEQFNDIYEVLVELFGEKKTFFVDEIQNIEGFESFVRRFYDNGFKFFITGSNAKLLSRELGTKLTGRHVDIRVRPFSFKEFLWFKEAKYQSIEDSYKTETRVEIKKLFQEYFDKGGMPEFLKYEDNEMLSRTYEDIVIKDIAVRHGIENVAQLKELYKYLITTFSSKFSFNSLKQNIQFGSSNTVKKFLTFLEETYFITTISKFDYSLKKQLANDKKIYITDNRFIPILSTKTTQDKGRLLENLVFNHFNEKQTVFYYQGKKECDFILVKNNLVNSAAQVCWELTEQNKQRETEGLIECMNELRLTQGSILTYDQEEEITLNGKKISVKPVWKWLLEN